MESVDIIPLLDASDRLVAEVAMDFHRYLYSMIDWKDRLICIKGPKGVGKTTLMLQHIREVFGARSGKAVYLPADHIWFSSHGMLEAVEYFHSHGFTHLFIDEIQHLPEWSRIIKTITDCYPKLYVVYSGSSILKISKGDADLSRRQAVYCLKGLSFREFMLLEGEFERPVLSLGELLNAHREIAGEICDKVKVLPLFEKYVKCGYYPMYRNVSSQFQNRLVAIVNAVLNVDLPSVEDVTVATVRKAKKMLMVLAQDCPQQPNMSALYRELETNRNMGLKLLDALERAELLSTVEADSPKLKRLSRPGKVFLGDTNIMHALVPMPDVGALRETFFANQTRAAGYKIEAPEKGDFVIDSRWLFEIGGRGKGFSQIKDKPDSYVVNDGIELGIGNKIPLWLFGFLY